MKNFYNKLKSGLFYIIFLCQLILTSLIFFISITLNERFILASLLLQLFYLLNYVFLYIVSYKKYGDPLKSFKLWIKSLFSKKNKTLNYSVSFESKFEFNASAEVIKTNENDDNELVKLKDEIKDMKNKILEIELNYDNQISKQNDLTRKFDDYKSDTDYQVKIIYVGQKDYPIFNHFLMIISIILLALSLFLG